MDRRSFLKSLFAGAAAVAAPKVFDLAPSWRKHDAGLFSPYDELKADALHRLALSEEDWLGTLSMLFPTGQAPLTALLGQLSPGPLPTGKFEWWEKRFPEQRVLAHVRDGTTVVTSQEVALVDPLSREYELRWVEAERRVRHYADPAELELRNLRAAGDYRGLPFHERLIERAVRSRGKR